MGKSLVSCFFESRCIYPTVAFSGLVTPRLPLSTTSGGESIWSALSSQHFDIDGRIKSPLKGPKRQI